MKISVLLFASLRERTGRENISLDLPGKTTVALLREKAAQQFPEIQRVPFSVAVNRKIAGKDELIREGDEVALLPPVSGG